MNTETTKAFLAGTLLPTIAFYFAWKRQRNELEAAYAESDDDDDSSVEPLPASADCKTWGMQHSPYKMVLCVNTELAMGKGKIAAQCCHAAVGCYNRATKACPAAVRAWDYTGCAKIALKCPSQDDMELIFAKAKSKNIPCYLVEDAGRTQIAAGSRTVVGIFGPVSAFEGITDHLKLM